MGRSLAAPSLLPDPHHVPDPHLVVEGDDVEIAQEDAPGAAWLPNLVLMVGPVEVDIPAVGVHQMCIRDSPHAGGRRRGGGRGRLG